MNLHRKKVAPAAHVDKIQMVPVAKIQRASRNSKAHPMEQVDRLAASIHAFGFLVPIVLHKGEVVAGEGRLQAAIRMGFQEVPVVEADHLTKEQARAFRIADNQLAAMTGFDEAMLSAELLALKDTSVDLSVLGFNPEELEGLINLGGDPPDDSPPPPSTGNSLKLTFTFEREANLLEVLEALGSGRTKNLPGHVLLDLIERSNA